MTQDSCWSTSHHVYIASCKKEKENSQRVCASSPLEASQKFPLTLCFHLSNNSVTGLYLKEIGTWAFQLKALPRNQLIRGKRATDIERQSAVSVTHSLSMLLLDFHFY